MTAPHDPTARPEADIFFEKLGKTTHPRARGFFHKHDKRKRGDRGRMEAWNLAVVAEWEAEGRGTYAVVNDGGDTDESIIHCNATFGEWDNKERVVQAAFDWTAAGLPKPTMAIWTSQAVDASLHFYWCYTKPQTDVMRWRLLQWRIIQLLDSDPSIENPSRIMRVPGCLYPGKGITQIDYDISTGEKIDFFELESKVWLAEQQRGLTVAGAVPEAAWKRFGEELEGRLGLVRPATTRPELAAKGPAQQQQGTSGIPSTEYPRNTIEDIKQALAAIAPRGCVPGTYKTRDRNILWGLAAALEAIGRPREEAAALVEEAGWKDWDALQIVRTGGEMIDEGTFWYHAKEAGYRSTKQGPFGMAQPAAADGGEADSSGAEADVTAFEQRLRGAADLSPLERLGRIKALADETGLHPVALERTLDKYNEADQDAQAIEEEREDLREEREQQTLFELLDLEYLLPRGIAEAIRLVTQYLPCNPVSAATLYITGQSSLLPLGTVITAIEEGTFFAPLNLFSVLVARTGSKKTPLKRAVLDEPLEAVKKIADSDNERRMKEWEENNRDVKESEKGPKPPKILVQVSKITPEGLSQQMMFHQQAKRGLLFLRDEFSGLIGSIGQYQQSGKGDGMQQLLELYDGGGEDSVYKNIETVTYTASHLSICSNSQPSVIEGYLKTGDHKGQWARFCMVPMPSRTVKLPAVKDLEMVVKVNNAKEYLRKVSMEMYQMPVRKMEISAEARVAFVEYENKEAELAKNRDDAIGALYNKSPGKVLRLAGILHCLAMAEAQLTRAEDKPKILRDPYTVSTEDLTRAINLVDALNRWMILLVKKMAREADGGGICDKVLAFARRKGGPVTYSQVVSSQSKKDRTKGINKETITKAFEVLVMEGKGTLDEEGRFKASP